MDMTRRIGLVALCLAFATQWGMAKLKFASLSGSGANKSDMIRINVRGFTSSPNAADAQTLIEQIAEFQAGSDEENEEMVEALTTVISTINANYSSSYATVAQDALDLAGGNNIKVSGGEYDIELSGVPASKLNAMKQVAGTLNSKLHGDLQNALLAKLKEQIKPQTTAPYTIHLKNRWSKATLTVSTIQKTRKWTEVYTLDADKSTPDNPSYTKKIQDDHSSYKQNTKKNTLPSNRSKKNVVAESLTYKSLQEDQPSFSKKGQGSIIVNRSTTEDRVANLFTQRPPGSGGSIAYFFDDKGPTNSSWYKYTIGAPPSKQEWDASLAFKPGQTVDIVTDQSGGVPNIRMYSPGYPKGFISASDLSAHYDGVTVKMLTSGGNNPAQNW